MSSYFVNGNGWRFDFQKNKIRYTGQWFETKELANIAEADKRKELIVKENSGNENTHGSQINQFQAPLQLVQYQTPTQPDMEFKTMASIRLDYLENYNALKQDGEHYKDNRLAIKKWLETDWGKKKCSEITEEDILNFLIKRRDDVSPKAANRHLVLINALFNLGIKKKWLSYNPAADIEPFPINEKPKKNMCPRKRIWTGLLKPL